MIFSENRLPLFRIMLFLMEHDLFGKPVATFPDHAVLMEHDLFGKPVATFPDHAVLWSMIFSEN
jgi:hypothetical protein